MSGNPPGRYLRRGSILLLVAWLAVLAVSFAQRQLRRRPAVGRVAIGDVTPGGKEGQPVRVQKGVVYSDTLGVQPTFRVAARETVEFASGWDELRDVEVWLYHEGEVAYGLVGQRARLNRSRGEAAVSGEAQVSLQEKIVLRAEGFSVKGPERVLTSQGPVTFAGPGWGGLAGGVRCSLADNEMEFVGGVSVSWRQNPQSPAGLVMLAPRVTYTRKRGLIRYPDGLTLLQGRLRVRAVGGEMQLAGSEGDLKTVRLLGPVRVDGVLEDGTEIDADSGNADLDSIGGDRFRLSAAANPTTGWAQARSISPGKGSRELTALRLIGEGSRSAWEWLEGQELACGTEAWAGEVPRHVEADSLRLNFENGRAATVTATNSVRVDLGDSRAEGGELTFSLASRNFTLAPAAGQRVALTSPDGLAWADRVEGAERTAVVARGKVTGTLNRQALAGPDEGPARFAADTSSISPDGARLTLEGDARIWQGQRLLRAQRLVYERDHDRIGGQGEVLTTAQVAGAGGAPGELKVRAHEMDYDREASRVFYAGDVRMDDARAMTTCQRLAVSLGAKGEVQLADLDGGVTVTDRTTGRTLGGTQARFNAVQDLFDIWGKPVVAQEPNGNQVKADHLRWLRTSGTVTVVGQADNPSETLYHPKEGTPTPRSGRRRP